MIEIISLSLFWSVCIIWNFQVDEGGVFGEGVLMRQLILITICLSLFARPDKSLRVQALIRNHYRLPSHLIFDYSVFWYLVQIGLSFLWAFLLLNRRIMWSVPTIPTCFEILPRSFVIAISAQLLHSGLCAGNGRCQSVLEWQRCMSTGFFIACNLSGLLIAQVCIRSIFLQRRSELVVLRQPFVLECSQAFLFRELSPTLGELLA